MTDSQLSLMKSVVVVVSLLLPATVGLAQERHVAKACATDIKTLCAGVKPGGGRIKACIKEHFKDLSGPCQAVLLKVVAVRKACAADVKKDCAGIKPGGGRIEACMKAHLGDLSEACKETLGRAAAGKK